MSGDGKTLKISSLAALFAGIATLVVGIVLTVGKALDIDACLTAADGLISAVYGVRTAILANVPSNTSKIRTKACILLVATVAVGAYLVFKMSEVQIVQICAVGVVCLIALIAVVVSSRIVKEQLRK